MANKRQGDHRLSSIVITTSQKKWIDDKREKTGLSYSAIIRNAINVNMEIQDLEVKNDR